MSEQLIRLICCMKDFEDNYMCNCGCCSDVMETFINGLHGIFSSVEEVALCAPYIKNLDSEVFIDDNYKDGEHDDDEIRNAIEEILRSNIEVKPIKFDYDLVLKYINDESLLIIYLDDISQEQLIELASKNPNVLYHVDSFSLDTLKRIIKNNVYAACIIDVDVMRDEFLYDSFLYKNRDTFLNDKELYDIYIDGLKFVLEEDQMKYIYMSEIAHNDVFLANFILNLDPRFIAYAGDDIRDNKEIMMKLISINNDNEYYLSDRLRNDADIQMLLQQNDEC